MALTLEQWRDRATLSLVIAGLYPAIQGPPRAVLESPWILGSSPRMTNKRGGA